jgi:hypothetical protein
MIIRECCAPKGAQWIDSEQSFYKHSAPKGAILSTQISVVSVHAVVDAMNYSSVVPVIQGRRSGD